MINRNSFLASNITDMRNKENVFLCIAIFYITYLLFPVFTNMIQPWLPCTAVSVLLLLLFPSDVFNSTTTKWFVCYCVITSIFLLSGRTLKIDIGRCTSFSQLIIEYAFMLPNIIISSILINRRTGKIYTLLGNYVLVLICVSFLIVLPQMQNMDLRNMARRFDETSEMAVGTINYTLLHAYIILIPVLYFCYLTFKGKRKWFYLLCLLLTSYVILKSSITTTIVMLVIEIGLLIAYNSKKRVASLIGVSILFILFFILFQTGTIVALLNIVQPFFSGTAVEEKIEAFKILAMTGSSTGSLGAREDLHGISWNAFFDNVLWGGGYAGGHSSIVDRMGVMGLIGFIPYIMIFISNASAWINRMNNYSRKYYLFSFLSVIVLLYTKGLFGQEGYLFFMVLLPIFSLLPYIKLSKNSSVINNK